MVQLDGKIRGLSSTTSVQYVEPSEYCELALSSKELVRLDQQHLGLRGLLDRHVDTCYLINERDLMRPTAS